MANTRYENFVLENKLKDQLTTSLSMLDFVTIDDTLTAEAGQIKRVHTYSSTGAAEVVAEGEGNSQSIEMSYTTKDYTVKTTQARFVYTDEDEMSDPYLVEGGLTNLANAITNKVTAEVVSEFEKATKKVTYTAANGVTYANIVDAIALLNKENDEGAGLFALVNPAMKGMLRKNLKDDLKYVEDNVRTGYIGTVCGVPIRVSKAVPDNTVIIGSAKAVTYYRKKTVETEQDREQNTRTNTVYGRLVGVAALTDEDEVALIVAG